MQKIKLALGIIGITFAQGVFAWTFGSTPEYVCPEDTLPAFCPGEPCPIKCCNPTLKCPEIVIQDDCCEYPDTYFGVNYRQIWITPQGDWHRILERNAPGFGFYFGVDLKPFCRPDYPYWGAELGYEWTANKPKNTFVRAGNSFLGIVDPTSDVQISGKVRFKSGYFDLNTFIPLPIYPCFQPDAIIAVGVSGMKPSMKFRVITGNPAGSPFEQMVGLVEGRSAAVWRFGLGLQTLVVEQVGVRVMWRYENTSILRGRFGVAENPGTRKIFSNAHSVTAGAYIKF